MKKLAFLTHIVLLLFYFESFSQTFKSQNCGTVGPKINNSGNVALAPFSGLPNKLTNEFGLKSITIYATITGTIAENQLYFDLQDPSKAIHRLSSPESFPQYNGKNQEFKVTFSACNSGGITNANDNVPFHVNGVYRPMGDNPLNKVNLSNVNPNGFWHLNIRTMKEISIDCLQFEFGPTCATVKTHKIVTENCKSYVQVTYDQINGPFCDNQDGNRFPDYYIKMAGTSDPITLWDAASHLKLAVPQGKSKIEFGTYYKNSQGIEHFSCPQIFEINVPISDTVKPTQNCPPSNVTATLDTEGKLVVNLEHPKFSDNCGSPTSYVNINYLDGATDLTGSVQFTNLPFSSGQFVTYGIKGVGRQVFDFITVDAAGNRATCTTVITTLPNPNSCANDTEAPYFPFGQCRSNKIYLVSNPNNTISFFRRDPFFVENCEIASTSLLLTYKNGATDKDGKTSYGPFALEPGKLFPYSIKGIGSVDFEYKVTDKKGNVGTCMSTISTRLMGGCATDVIPPTMTSCMPSAIININGQTNTGSFKLITPLMTDNCGVDSTRIVMQYLDGAKGLNGETYREFFDVGSGVVSKEFYLVGTGKVLVTFFAYDFAGNVSACSATISSRTNYVDPCATFNPSISVAGDNCTNNQISVNNHTGAVRIDWKNGNQLVTTSVIPSTPSKEGIRVAGTGVSGKSNTQLGAAQNIVVDKAGNLYVCDSENSRVLKFAPGSASCTVVAGGNGAGNAPNQLDVPYAIQVDNENNLYVAEYNNDRVTKWAPGSTTGIVVAGGNGTGNADNQLNGPFGISLDGNGNIYVADYGNFRIQKWGQGAINGVTVAGTGIQGTGPNQLDFIRDVVVNDEGEIFVLETKLGRVKKFPANSTKGTNGIIVIQDTDDARCMAMDAAGNIYITNIIDHYVKKFHPNSTASTAGTIVAGGNGQGSGANQLDGPRGVAIDANGAIFIADQKNFRVQKWDQTFGTISNVFTPGISGNYTAVITNTNGCKTITNNLVIAACNVSSQLVINDACIQAGQMGFIPITVKGFSKINALEFTLQLSKTSTVSLDSITNRYFSNLQYNKLANGDLKIVWDDINGQEINLPDGTKLFDIAVKSTNDFNAPVSISGIDLVVVSSVLSTVAIIPNNFAICTSIGVSPNGKIADAKDKPHATAKVSLTLSGQQIAETNTSTDGRYGFNPVPKTHRITPYDNTDIKKGVNVADVSLIRRYTLSNPVISDNYNLVAADINKDGIINILDVILLNRVVLEMSTEFPNNTSWRFLPKKLDISSNPFKVDWPNYIDMTEPNLDYNSLDFVAIKVGDVNNSALSLNSSLESRNTYTVSIPDTSMAFRQNMKIPVRYSGTEKMAAFTMKIKYDRKVIKFVKIESGSIPGFGVQHYNEKDGTIIISYDHPQGSDFTPTDVLMNIVFDNITKTGLSALVISDALFFNKNLSEIGLQIKNGSINYLSSPTRFKSNEASIHSYPNPFTTVWNLDIKLASPDKIKIEITDIAGRVLKQLSSTKISEFHNISIDDLDYQGLLNCKITSSKESFTIRALKM